MQQRQLGRSGLTVSALGLGCMGMTYAYDTAASRSESEALATVKLALDQGINFLDTAEVYGPWENESLLGRAIAGRRHEVIIASKFGFKLDAQGTVTGLDSHPDNVRAACEQSLRRLGVETIDLYYQHRLDPNVAIEETVGAMADLVRAGKVRYLGLSEVGVEILRRACAVHPIAALQSEYSLWERNVEPQILPACRELGVGFVPFSPLGRGFLTGQAPRAEGVADPSDIRADMPRFQGENYDRNLALVAVLKGLAERKGCTSAQLALAWLLSKGPDIVPIPGTKSCKHLAENAAAAEVTLSGCDLMAIEQTFPRNAAAGARYNAQMESLVNR